MNPTAQAELRKRVQELRSLPTSPAVLKPLLELLRKAPSDIELSEVVRLVSYEKAIAAQLLRLANSALYARARPAESIQAAVFALGTQRIEDILLSNYFTKLVPDNKWAVDPIVFWRHSFGCALVCRHFAEQIAYPDTDQAYLAGLLHDLGIVVTSLTYTEQYRAVLASALQQGKPLHEQEKETMGFTHCESGVALAKIWQLPPAIAEVIEWHHTISDGPSENPLIAMTHLVDLLCRMRNLGYGYQEWRAVDLEADPAWNILQKHCPKLAKIDLARFTLDLDDYLVRITSLVDEIFSPSHKSEPRETNQAVPEK